MQFEPQIVSDGFGGAVITWSDYRNGATTEIYAQRIDGTGSEYWTSCGVLLCTADGSQQYPAITSDGAAGAIVAWWDARGSDYDIYSQHINASGTVQWNTDGVPLCTVIENQTHAHLVSDGNGGAVAVWSDNRAINADIYSQWIDYGGRVGFLPPVITSVDDVPNDNGGRVRIAIARASWDEAGWGDTPVSSYNVWERVDDPVLLSMLEEESMDNTRKEMTGDFTACIEEDGGGIAGLRIIGLDGRSFARSRDVLGAAVLPPGTWEIVGSFTACQQDTYLYRASTAVDCSDDPESDNTYAVYVVSAHTTDPFVWTVSEPDSGCSIDNLAPCMPMSLSGTPSDDPEGLDLSWDANTEPDLGGYKVYRGTNPDFVPDMGNLLTTICETGAFDGDWSWAAGYCYKVSAVDLSENESEHATLCNDQITGVDPMPTPEVTFLEQNYPNPFNPITTIAFGLRESGHVTLKIYDAAGRTVVVLIDESRPAGRYAVEWTGRFQNGLFAASGVYFYRLQTKEFEETRKMILLR
jgi:hypothetical protein